MKRFLALTLTLCLVLGLCACGETAPKETEPESNLQLGFARAVITPDDSVPLNGYGTSTDRMSTQVLDDLTVTCLAMTDGETTALLYSQDLLNATAVLTPTLRSLVSDAVKVPTNNIFFSSIGTYSAPDMKSEHESMVPFMDKYKAAVVKTAQDAVADMAPVTMQKATTEVEGLSFCMHYTTDADTVEDQNYGFFEGKQITGHVIEPDRTMRLVKAEREGKPAVLMVSWQCRPTLTGAADKTVISADFPGYMREKIEAETGMNCVYFSGAFGDIEPNSLIPEEQHGLEVKEYGEKVAQAAIAALDGMTPLAGGTVGVFPSNYNCPINHEDEDKLEDAKTALAERHKNGYDAGHKLALELGFRSIYQAGSITYRPDRKERESFEISSMRFGGLGFLMAPVQLYSQTGEKTYDEAPTDFAFLVCNANAAWNNIPSKQAFDYGGYLADTSYFARGSGERMGELLNELLLMTME